jgi:uncharacterized Zn ribbon protein
VSATTEHPRCPSCESDVVWVEDAPEVYCGACEHEWIEQVATQTELDLGGAS